VVTAAGGDGYINRTAEGRLAVRFPLERVNARADGPVKRTCEAVRKN
jgi:hypothetical protein